TYDTLFGPLLHNITVGTSVQWEVSGEASAQALIRVRNVTRDVSDVSNAIFTIGSVERSLTLLTPEGGESWKPGTVERISWETLNNEPTDQIVVRLSTNGGQSYINLASAQLQSFEGSFF